MNIRGNCLIFIRWIKLLVASFITNFKKSLIYIFQERRTKLYVCEDCGHTTTEPGDHFMHLKSFHPQNPVLLRFYDKRQFKFSENESLVSEQTICWLYTFVWVNIFETWTLLESSIEQCHLELTYNIARLYTFGWLTSSFHHDIPEIANVLFQKWEVDKSNYKIQQCKS